MKIEGYAAVVTGGASGLGAATAAMLVRIGAKVTILDLNEAQGRSFATEIGADFSAVSVSDSAGVDAALAEAEARNGTARILVNCAGIYPPQRTVSPEGQPHDLADFRKTVEINLIGSFNVASKFASRLALAATIDNDGERGVIINTSSVAAFEGQIGHVAYSASKGGLVGMTLPMARDLAQYGIRVVTIAPGIFLTAILINLPPAVKQTVAQHVPFPSRPGHPDEYAQMVEAIIRNPMLNGETIRLDGALRMPPR